MQVRHGADRSAGEHENASGERSILLDDLVASAFHCRIGLHPHHPDTWSVRISSTTLECSEPVSLRDWLKANVRSFWKCSRAFKITSSSKIFCIRVLWYNEKGVLYINCGHVI